MSYVYEKKYTKRYEITDIARDFYLYSEATQKANKIAKCKMCGHKFKIGESVNLGFFIRMKNQLLCNGCADTAIDGGANEIRKGQRR